ncbi:MAG: transcriptional repressor NrdR [Agathobacter sp.]|nr:transcriptional repressor NrdR [Peptococcaceae bacterium]MBQ2800603.1 transcriptional repressor NrdR [Lachnospiraceae bacterium]MBQ3560184.1 transcriptional repressor NrdR [Agathobacter sp.]MBO5429359.1 transcriptional repressor NrdR [Peptococcaceae bacterium]MBP3625325.1 transcriptional repressor NrdR [Peptococcaceae bacterium]
MQCPVCQNDSKVLDTRWMEEENSIRRRRECTKCGKRFITYEKIESKPLVVVKKSGRKELFDESKVLKGLAKACEKRPISFEQLQQMVRDVERELKGQYTEVPVHLIGETIMQRLMEIDEVAYVRFASVYKEFDDVQTFIREIEVMKERNNNG